METAAKTSKPIILFIAKRDSDSCDISAVTNALSLITYPDCALDGLRSAHLGYGKYCVSSRPILGNSGEVIHSTQFSSWSATPLDEANRLSESLERDQPVSFLGPAEHASEEGCAHDEDSNRTEDNDQESPIYVSSFSSPSLASSRSSTSSSSSRASSPGSPTRSVPLNYPKSVRFSEFVRVREISPFCSPPGQQQSVIDCEQGPNGEGPAGDSEISGPTAKGDHDCSSLKDSGHDLLPRRGRVQPKKCAEQSIRGKVPHPKRRRRQEVGHDVISGAGFEDAEDGVSEQLFRWQMISRPRRMLQSTATRRRLSETEESERCGT